MNKTYLLSAIALGAMVITWAPVEARADGLACSQASAKALQQRTAAGKCDTADRLTPEMQAALALHEKAKKEGMKKDVDEEPKQEASNGEGGEDAGDEGGAGGAGGGGKGKKLPGDKIIQKHPGGDINIGDKPVVKKQPQGGVATGEEIEELEFGEPNHTPVIAEEVEELEFGEPEKKPVLAEEVEELEFGEPAKKPALAEKVEDLELAKKDKKEPSLAKKIEDLFFGEPTKDAYNNDHGGKGDRNHGNGQGGHGDKGGKESKGPKGGNGFAG